MKYSERSSATAMTVTAKMFETIAAACCCYYGGESASPTKQTSNDKETRYGANIFVAWRRVKIRSSIVCFQPLHG